MMFSGICDATLRWKALIQSPAVNLLRAVGSGASKPELLRCCRVLQVPVNSDIDEIRTAYIALAKKYHPDSGSPDADPEKFKQVESAYRTLHANYSSEPKVDKQSDEHDESGRVEEYDIRHTAPQHRQYLSYHGYGSGTPSQRQKQYQTQRAVQAVDNVMSHRIHKINLNCSHNREEALAVKDKVEAKKIKTRFGMDRLVEDLIQESMAKGDFDNLPGKGKPLKQDISNPYIDFTTHKLNEVLIDNGFTPEWILLQKEIREERDHLRLALTRKRRALGPLPLSYHDAQLWQIAVENLKPFVTQINTKINKYNLLVPILQKQMLQVQLDKEAMKILEEVKGESIMPSKIENKDRGKESGLFDFFHEIFGNK